MRLGALLSMGALGLVSGCGGGGAASSTAPSDAVGTVEGSASLPASGPAERRADADAGVRLRASRPPVTMRVRLVEIVDPAPPTPSFSPQRENRFVAARLELRNEGGAAYTDTVSTGASLVDATGGEHPAAIVEAVEPGLRRVTIGPRETVSGFVTFELPKGARVAELRVRLNSGFGPETGVWAIP